MVTGFTLTDISFILAALIEILVPVMLAIIVARKFKVSWAVFFLGMLLFFVSLIRLPLNNYVAGLLQENTAAPYTIILIFLFASITAGLFEEGVRVFGIGLIIRQKNYYKGLMYGIGHGGGESMIFVGLLTLVNYIIYRYFPEIMPSMAISQFGNLQWCMPLIGALERIFAIIIQVSLSVMVMHAFLFRKYYFITIAIISHIIIDFTALYINYRFGVLFSEISVFIFALAGVAVIILLRPKHNPVQAINGKVG